MAENEFHIKSDSPAAGELMFWSIVGHEALSRPSTYELTVLSKNAQISATDILGRAFDVVIEFFDADGGKHERHCQGHAVRFVRRAQVGRYFEYRIRLRSWFWLLEKRRNSRIQQDKPVLDVLDAMFEDSPIKRFKKTKADHVIGTHDPRRYCVQHQETDYRFASRLLEDEGIYYWFDAHDAPGTMHLSDASDVGHEKLPVADTLRYVADAASEGRFNEITRWVSARRFETGKHASRDSDFKGIRKKLGVHIDASDDHELADFEEFEFPGGYFDTGHAEGSAKVRGDELTARRDRHWALTTWPDVAAGRSFKFEGDPDGVRDGEYIIGACTFVAVHPGYESLKAQAQAQAQPLAELFGEMLADDAVNADALPLLRELIDDTPALARAVPGAAAFLITALPMELPFKPPRLTPPVRMPGPQSAIVVGPEGDEIHADEHGRVKVHFHWDRYDKSNEKSTCWVRVSQPWAGKGWGGYFIPRIGQEVIVDFLNGDPDRPIIIGRLYNDDQPLPFDSHTQSGFKSRSTPGGGGANFNEIKFEDKIGAEVLSLHAERNMSTSVELDDSTSVGQDQSVSVKRDQTVGVQHDRTVNVKNNETKTIEQFQKLKVGANQDNHVVGYQTTNIDIDHALLVKGNHKIHVGAIRTDITAGNEVRTVGGSQTVTVVGPMKYKAPSMMFETGHLEFKVTGGNSVKFDGGPAPYTAAFQKYTLVSNTELNLSAIGNINSVSVGSNTTVLGPNTSGYIGNNTEFATGITRSTFLGLSVETALGAAMSNFLGVKVDNTLAVSMESTAGLKLERNSARTLQAPIHTFLPGAGSASGDAASGMARLATGLEVAGIAMGAVGAISGARATLSQYEEAEQLIDQIIASGAADDIPGMNARLARMKWLTGRMATEGIVDMATLGVGEVLGGILTLGISGATVSEREAGGLLSRDANTGNPNG